jgi:hypothetical protein
MQKQYAHYKSFLKNFSTELMNDLSFFSVETSYDFFLKTITVSFNKYEMKWQQNISQPNWISLQSVLSYANSTILSSEKNEKRLASLYKIFDAKKKKYSQKSWFLYPKMVLVTK